MPISRTRLYAFRGLAALLALTLTLFGGQLLFAGWLSEEHAVHELGWGVLEGVLIVVPLVVSLRRPQDHPAAMQVVLAALVGMVVTMLLTTFDAFTLVMLALGAVLTALHPARGEVLRFGEPRTPALLAAAAGAVLLTVHALDQAALQRGAGDAHAALDHYTGTAGAAVAIAFVALFAPAAARGARLPAICAGVGAAVLGLAWALFPDQSSSLGAAAGFATVAGGIAFAALVPGGRRAGFGAEAASAAR